MRTHKKILTAIFFLAWLGIFLAVGGLEQGRISSTGAVISCVILYVIIAVTGVKTGLLTLPDDKKRPIPKIRNGEIKK